MYPSLQPSPAQCSPDVAPHPGVERLCIPCRPCNHFFAKTFFLQSAVHHVDSTTIFSQKHVFAIGCVYHVGPATIFSQKEFFAIGCVYHVGSTTIFSQKEFFAIGWIALVAMLASIPLTAFHLLKIFSFERSWPELAQWFLRQLTWLSPLLWFLAFGLFLTLLIRCRAASIALLVGIWVGENSMYGLLIGTIWLHPIFLFATSLTPLAALSPFWLSNRLQLLATAFFLLLIVWLQLHNSEALLQKMLGEE